MTTINKREVHRFLDEHPDIPFQQLNLNNKAVRAVIKLRR